MNGADLDLDGGPDPLDLDTLLNEEEKSQLELEQQDAAKKNGKAGDFPADDALKRANELLAKQVAESSKRIAELEESRSKFDQTTRDYTPPPTPAPQPPPQVDRGKVKEELDKLWTEAGPGEWGIRLFEAARQAAISEMETRLGPVASGAAGTDIQQYIATRSDAGPEAIAEFQAMVRDPNTIKALASQAPEVRRNSLDFMFDAAVGRASRKAPPKQNNRDRQPPQIAGGQTISMGTETPNSYKGKALNEVQKEIVRSAREAGITDPKRIRAMIEDAE
jgi:hypothetical protein